MPRPRQLAVPGISFAGPSIKDVPDKAAVTNALSYVDENSASLVIIHSPDRRRRPMTSTQAAERETSNQSASTIPPAMLSVNSPQRARKAACYPATPPTIHRRAFDNEHCGQLVRCRDQSL